MSDKYSYIASSANIVIKLPLRDLDLTNQPHQPNPYTTLSVDGMFTAVMKPHVHRHIFNLVCISHHIRGTLHPSLPPSITQHELQFVPPSHKTGWSEAVAW